MRRRRVQASSRAAPRVACWVGQQAPQHTPALLSSSTSSFICGSFSGSMRGIWLDGAWASPAGARFCAVPPGCDAGGWVAGWVVDGWVKASTSPLPAAPALPRGVAFCLAAPLGVGLAAVRGFFSSVCCVAGCWTSRLPAGVGSAASAAGAASGRGGFGGDSTASSLSLSVNAMICFPFWPAAPVCSQLGKSDSSELSAAGAARPGAANSIPPTGRCARGSSSSLELSPMAAGLIQSSAQHYRLGADSHCAKCCVDGTWESLSSVQALAVLAKGSAYCCSLN